jgi:RHS repeat-associated protein
VARQRRESLKPSSHDASNLLLTRKPFLLFLHSLCLECHKGPIERSQRNVAQDLQDALGLQLAEITGFTIASYTPGTAVLIDDLRLSNSVTVERNSLTGAATGGITCSRTVNPATMLHTDNFLHYNQVGTVIARSDATGNGAVKVYQDVFGNALADISTGAWATSGQGNMWGQNTKKFDESAALTYMYQRWYDPQTGTFASKAPYAPSYEHPYSFAVANPSDSLDPDGRDVITIRTYSPIIHDTVIVGNPTDGYVIYSFSWGPWEGDFTTWSVLIRTPIKSIQFIVPNRPDYKIVKFTPTPRSMDPLLKKYADAPGIYGPSNTCIGYSARVHDYVEILSNPPAVVPVDPPMWGPGMY